MDEEAARSKKEALVSLLKEKESLLIAFSGGVDSSFLLAVAKEALGKQVHAATARSIIHPSYEIDAAIRVGDSLGVGHTVFQSRETSLEEFVANTRDRCYYCKKGLFSQLLDIAEELGLKAVAHGANRDDRGDYRPGFKAAKEAGAIAPLMDVGLTKEEIRFLSREMGLPTWNKPSNACLASRIPYGTPVTPARVRMVEEAEQFLTELGFETVRVRHHGTVARIEGRVERLAGFLEETVRSRIVSRFREIGFLHTALDLEGYVSGKMNRDLEVDR
jgi:uncharacterized protein